MNERNKQQLQDCRTDIVKIKEWINGNPANPLVRYLTAYAVVCVSGTVEYVFKQMIYEYLSLRVHDNTRKYLEYMIIATQKQVL